MILGVLLAAGTGSRFDGGAESEFDGENQLDGGNEFDAENKLLADLDGQPIVTHAARTLTESSLDATLAVVGHDAEAVERALPGEIEVSANPDYEQGQSASVRRGIAAARERDAEAVLFALGDMPCVSAETVEAILRKYRNSDSNTPPGIVAPRFDGQRGNPVLFDSRYFDALANVEGDRGGRDLLESEPVAWVEVEDSAIRRDVDTLADLRSLRNE